MKNMSKKWKDIENKNNSLKISTITQDCVLKDPQSQLLMGLISIVTQQQTVNSIKGLHKIH